MRKCLLISLIVIICTAGRVSAQILSQDENKPITEGQFAIMLIQAIGYEDQLPAGAVAGDYVILLERYGIGPLSNWQPEDNLTYGRLATILSRAMNLEHKPINDTDKCFSNVCEINKGWYEKYKETGSTWIPLNEFLSGKPVCPFGLAYEDKTGRHIVARHNHPNVAETEKAYLDDLSKRNIMLAGRQPSGLVSGYDARQILESTLSNLLLARGYLAPPTPILPKEAVQLKPAGRLVFIVYEKGLVDDRKVQWPVLWSKDEKVGVAIAYSHDAKLNNKTSIKMYINGIEVSACAGTWADLFPDEHIWIGSQSQSGIFPAGIYIYNLRIYDLIKTDFVSEDRDHALLSPKSTLLWSLLDTKEEIFSPKIGNAGEISKKTYTDLSGSLVPGEGFISDFDNEYIKFPTTGNINMLKGTIEFQVRPTFVSSTVEHVLINNVKWDAKDGASGFYLYYQPEEKT